MGMGGWNKELCWSQYLVLTRLLVLLHGYLAVCPELDLVEQEDQLTHEIFLQEEIDPEITLGMSYIISFSNFFIDLSSYLHACGF